MDTAQDYYSTLTMVSFTLLSLWFVVIQLAPDRWRGDLQRHRSTRHVALHFLLPGMMGLGSVLAGSNDGLWRVTFGVFGFVGIIESVRYLQSRPPSPTRTVRALRVLDPLLYAFVTVIAIFHFTLHKLSSLQFAGIFTSLLLMAGLAYLWVTFAERPSGAAAPPPPFPFPQPPVHAHPSSAPTVGQPPAPPAAAPFPPGGPANAPRY